MNATSVICLGNRFVADDDVGCRVFDYLSQRSLPAGLDIVDGGLCGLDLLRLVEGRRRVVFVDTVVGLAGVDEIIVLSQDRVAAYAGRYGHGAGLPYLLHLLPQICDAPLPEIALAGAKAGADEPAIRALAARSLELAIHGIH